MGCTEMVITGHPPFRRLGGSGGFSDFFLASVFRICRRRAPGGCCLAPLSRPHIRPGLGHGGLDDVFLHGDGVFVEEDVFHPVEAEQQKGFVVLFDDVDGFGVQLVGVEKF